MFFLFFFSTSGNRIICIFCLNFERNKKTRGDWKKKWIWSLKHTQSQSSKSKNNIKSIQLCSPEHLKINTHFFFYPRLRRKYPQRPAPLLITIRDDNFSWSSSINSIFLFIALWSLYLFFLVISFIFWKSPIDRFPNLISFFFKQKCCLIMHIFGCALKGK